MQGKVRKLLFSIMIFIFMVSNVFAADTASDQQMRDCLKKQDWQNAISCLGNLINQSPNEAATFIISGDNKELWGSKLPDAIEILKTAAQSAPKDAVGLKLRVGLADCYKNLEKWDQALSVIETIGKDYPDEARLFHGLRAICYFFKGKQPEALVEIKTAVDSYTGASEDKKLMIDLLNCYPYDDSNRIIRSVYALLRYLPDGTDKQRASIYKFAWKTTMDLGNVDMANAVHTRAISWWEKAKADNPDDLEILSLLIHAYLDVKDYDKAIPLCKEIIASKPEMAADALTVLAECMNALGKGREGLAFQVDYYKQHPELKAAAEWVYARTLFYTDTDKAKTIPLFEKILADYPDFEPKAELRSLLVFAYRVNGKTSKAVRVLKDMLEAAPDSKKIDISTTLAEIYSLINYSKAELLLNQLIKDNPSHHLMPKWKMFLAECSFSKGDPTTARDIYKAVYEEYPNSQYGFKAQFKYAQCCFCLGDKDTGKAALQDIVNKCPDNKWFTAAAEGLKAIEKR